MQKKSSSNLSQDDVDITQQPRSSVDKSIPALRMKDVILLTPKHIPLLKQMITEEVNEIFGDFDINEIIRNSFISLGVLGPIGELVGAVAFKTYPNIKSIPPWSWVEWIRKLYNCENLIPRNSMWIHLLLWEPRYRTTFLTTILQYYFRQMRFKHFILCCIPPDIKTISWLGQYANRILPRGCLDPLTTTTIGLMARQYYVNSYKIRKAVEEDNDDLIPLIARYSSRLSNIYGEYYIAELLTRFPKSKRHIIVAEYEGIAVAVSILSEVVNFEILNDHFELVCFHGLRTPHEGDRARNATLGVSYTDEIEEQLITSKLDNIKPHSTSARKRRQNRDVDENWALTGSIYELVLQKDEKNDDQMEDKQMNEEHMTNLRSLPTVQADFNSSSFLMNYDDYDNHLNQEADRVKKLMKEQAKEKDADKNKKNKGRRKSRFPYNFYGKKNVFAVEVLGSKEGHEEALELLIEASFESFPDRDYICLTIPTTHSPVNFLKDFVRVAPRSTGTFPQELYILHRNTVQDNVIVRMASAQDKRYIDEFLGKMNSRAQVRVQVDFAMSSNPRIDNSSNLCFLMVACYQIVGLAVLSEKIHVDYVTSHYATYPWIDRTRLPKGSFAVIEHLVIYPAFQNLATHFLNELHVGADYPVLFYVITPKDQEKGSRRPICNIIQQMVPIVSRFVPDYSTKYLQGICMPPEHVTKKETPYSLYLSTAKVGHTARIEINSRIVVIGTGITATSFLQTLICTTSTELLVTFTNVVVVSPHHVNHVRENVEEQQMFFIRRSHSSHTASQLSALRSHLSFTTNVMTEIHRQDKRIIMSDGSFLPYDILVLLVGEQYQAPSILNVTELSDLPANVFIVNTESEATLALKKVIELMKQDYNPDGEIIVYGHDLQCYCAIEALREYGIPAELLTFVNPVSPTLDKNSIVSYDNLTFDDPEVEVAVMNILQKQRINMYQGYLHDWVKNTDTNLVKQVCIKCFRHMITLDCKCIFIFAHKSISKRAFNAIANAGLVFDGRLVIDSNFRTNDPRIYSAGTVTKYSRKYHADHLSHLYYNSEEVGHKLGLYLRKILIPESFKPRNIDAQDYCPLQSTQAGGSLPVFTKPVVKSCRIAGGLNYCHITKPGKQNAAELKITKTNFGKQYVTGDMNNLDKQGYFTMHINELNEVETITCLTKDKILVNSLIEIYGKHVSLLNNLEMRFELKMVPDLFEFFKQPWTCAIYYDRFTEVRNNIKQRMFRTLLLNGKTLAETARDYLVENKWEHLNNKQTVEILKLFNASSIRDNIENQIIEYIEENTMELPMYAHPELIKNILYAYEKSPMFTD